MREFAHWFVTNMIVLVVIFLGSAIAAWMVTTMAGMLAFLAGASGINVPCVFLLSFALFLAFVFTVAYTRR